MRKSALALAGCSGECAPAQGETLTLATYNVENFVATNRVTEAGFRKE